MQGYRSCLLMSIQGCEPFIKLERMLRYYYSSSSCVTNLTFSLQLESANMDDNRSVASSIVSELRMSRLRDNIRTSSLNNLLPEDELSEAINEEMSGYCLQTETVAVEQTNGHHKRSSCDGGCSGPGDKNHLESNKMQAFEQNIVLSSNSKDSNDKVGVPAVVVTPCTPESQLQCEQMEVTDSYEVTV